MLVSRIEHGLERKKIVYLLLSWDVGVFQGEVKIEQRANKWKKCCNRGMAHPTLISELCGYPG